MSSLERSLSLQRTLADQVGFPPFCRDPRRVRWKRAWALRMPPAMRIDGKFFPSAEGRVLTFTNSYLHQSDFKGREDRGRVGTGPRLDFPLLRLRLTSKVLRRRNPSFAAGSPCSREFAGAGEEEDGRGFEGSSHRQTSNGRLAASVDRRRQPHQPESPQATARQSWLQPRRRLRRKSSSRLDPARRREGREVWSDLDGFRNAYVFSQTFPFILPQMH